MLNLNSTPVKINTITKKQSLFKPLVVFASFLLLIIVIAYMLNSLSLTTNKLQNFITQFLSIILEALPFILIGSFISSLIQIFISEETIEKCIPKNTFIAILTASLMGLIFPVCECVIIPIVRRLIKKGVPVYVGITFMLSVPIVNPIVLLSTYYAFQDAPHMVLLRGGVGLIAACIIGYLISLSIDPNESPLIAFKNTHEHNSCSCSHHNHKHEHSTSSCTHNHCPVENRRYRDYALEVIDHTAAEFYDVGKMLIFGALLSASFKVFISRSVIASIGGNSVLSILIMVLLAFTLSLCSEADAFIARTFMEQFTEGSVLGFLILGPMIDIKNLMMLLGTFKKSFVIRLTLYIFSICSMAALLVNVIGHY